MAETLHWYIVHVYSGYELQAKRLLQEQITLKNMTEFFDDILMPVEEIVEMRNGQPRKSSRKFFPGYLLVHMAMNHDSWHLVRNVPKIMGFIGGKSDTPTPLSQSEADAILQRIKDKKDKPQPRILFEAGEVVRVISGPFNDFNGVVEKVNYEKNRLWIFVTIFGRSTPVELEFDQVVKD